ncbi:hypothetical protein [Gimesia aquarii]|uniref:Uncharacterized protein n=1 Tax=Gimesia aquarii TaxID=2527964 RepID=A0A517VWK4_9PLAN|nr:hypothetical protein [Gimesia aquarii]QDT97384.1 hypothetical protein V144x_28590 [Gimesia aquarii]
MKIHQFALGGSQLTDALRYFALIMVTVGGFTYYSPDLMDLLPKHYEVDEINYKEEIFEYLVEQIGENTGQSVSVKFKPYEYYYSLAPNETSRAIQPAEVISLFSNQEKNEKLEVRFQTFYYGPEDHKERTGDDGKYLAQLDKHKILFKRLCSEHRDIKVRGYVSNESGTVLVRKRDSQKKYTEQEIEKLLVEKISRLVLICQYLTYEDVDGVEHRVDITTGSDEIENAILHCDRFTNISKIRVK